MVSSETPGGARAVARCDLLGRAPYSALPDRLFRAYLTPAHTAATEALQGWMAEAGLATHVDPAGNLIGRYEGREPNAPAILIGSHIDSVRDGGRYDGPLGIMLGIECVDRLHRGERRLANAIEIIAFGDEEGSRFPVPMLTSRAVAGTLAADMLDISDADGVTLADALAGCGLDIDRFGRAARSAKAVRAYVEVHIEQGPALEAADLPVATVSGIAAQRRYQVSVTGSAGHAGTSPMALRRDALAAAAEMVLAVEQVGTGEPADLVATVGSLEVSPGAPNVVPGATNFTIDVRAGAGATRDAAAAAILAAIARIAARRDVSATATLTHDMAASPCDPALVAGMDKAIADAGLPPYGLVSGAGHDAMVMAALCPTAMLFVRCAGGISHNPAEAVAPSDVEAALEVLCRFVEKLGETGA